MAFTVSDVRDLLRVLRENPEWKEEVRRELLGEELLSLPALIRQNSEAIDRLAAQMTRSEERLKGVEDRLEAVEAETKRTRVDVNDIRGMVYEDSYRTRASGIFGRMLHRIRVVEPRELEAFENAAVNGDITLEESLAVRRLDLIVEGTEGRGDDRHTVLLAVEVSLSLDDDDVRRAAHRAEILRRLGYDARPVAAGRAATAWLQKFAAGEGVQMILDQNTQ